MSLNSLKIFREKNLLYPFRPNPDLKLSEKADPEPERTVSDPEVHI